MKKFWYVIGAKNDGRLERFESYDEAVIDAKHKVANNRDSDYYILETVAVAKQPVPEVEITKL
jgi:hypothetical protein